MRNLNRWEIANHMNTSVKETYPSGREASQPSGNGANIPTGGEFMNRNHSSAERHLREDRTFTQSLWGRR